MFGYRFTHDNTSVDYVETWYGCYIARTSLQQRRITNQATSILLGTERCNGYLEYLLDKHTTPPTSLKNDNPRKQ